MIVPGDAAPNGATFDYAQNSAINDVGDVVFEAHLKGYECPGGTPDPSLVIGCNATGVYLRKAGAVINDSGEILFAATLTTGDTVLVLASPRP